MLRKISFVLNGGHSAKKACVVALKHKQIFMYATTTIPNLHTEYRLWISELNFFKEEVGRFEQQLESVINHNNGFTISAGVEQFQNRFIREKEVIDELKHKLNISERQLAAFVKELNGLGLQSIRMDNHTKLRDDMGTFRKLYGELKQSFRKFEAVSL